MGWLMILDAVCVIFVSLFLLVVDSMLTGGTVQKDGLNDTGVQ